jgi:Fe-S oxidoreductase/FAD/FMN-containing dehydrogenase
MSVQTDTSRDAFVDRLVEDLSDGYRGDLLTDAASRGAYRTGPTPLGESPLAVARPVDTDDLKFLLDATAGQPVTLIPRGAGTSSAKRSQSSAVVIDFSRHFRQIDQLEGHRVRVGAGVTLEQLDDVLRPAGQTVPGARGMPRCRTCAGVFASDAAGPLRAAVGSLRQCVTEVQLMLSDGTLLTLGREPLQRQPGPIDDVVRHERYRALISGVGQLLESHAELLAASTAATQQALQLHDVLQGGVVDLPRLLSGSQGCLGFITSLVLETVPLPQFTAGCLLTFATFEGAVTAIPRLNREEAVACELLDRRLLLLAREQSAWSSDLLTIQAEAALVLKVAASSEQELRTRLGRLATLVHSQRWECGLRLVTSDPVEQSRLEELPGRAGSQIHRLNGAGMPRVDWGSLAVPPAEWSSFLEQARQVLQKRGWTAVTYADASAGRITLAPLFPPEIVPVADELASAGRELWQAAVEHQGGATRQSSLELWQRQVRDFAPLLQQLQRVFDPAGRLQPWTSDDGTLPQRTTLGMLTKSNVNGSSASASPPLPVGSTAAVTGTGTGTSSTAIGTITAGTGGTSTTTGTTIGTGSGTMISTVTDAVELQLRWSPTVIQSEIDRCHRCGDCRQESLPGRMCPFFHGRGDELASPRAKVSVWQDVFTAAGSIEALTQPHVQHIVEQCFNCKQCVRECPSNVNVPHLSIEARAQSVANFGMPRADWFAARIPDWAPWLSRMGPVLNLLLGRFEVRWVLEKLVGLSRRRLLPAWARQSFWSLAEPRWLSPPALQDERPVILFLDHHGTWHEPQIPLLLIRLLEQQGLTVHVPPQQLPSGMAAFSAGDIDTARSLAEHHLKLFAEFARVGCPIVSCEPAAIVCLKHEYPRLVDWPEARMVADVAVEAGAFVQRLRSSGRWKSTLQSAPVAIHYHTPCHTRFLYEQSPWWEICTWIPELQAVQLEAGCSGMAGAYGLTAKNFPRSMEIGQRLGQALQSRTASWSASECSSCRLQMQQLSATPSLHPIQLLAWSSRVGPPPRTLQPPPGQRRLMTDQKAR